MKIRSRWTLPALAILALLVIVTAPMIANANGQEPCPNGGDWVKVDGLSGTSYTYTAPAGKLVAEVCYKHSTYVHYDDVTPPQATVTVVADWHTNEQGRDIQHDLSHASFRLVSDYEPCTELDDAVLVDTQYGEWSDWVLNPSTGLEERERTVTYFYEVRDGRDHRTVCDEYTEEVIEKQTRRPDDPTPTPTPTDEPQPTPTPTPKPCKIKRVGVIFRLTGGGRTCFLASFQKNPNTGNWAIPNAEAQGSCCFADDPHWRADKAVYEMYVETDCYGNILRECQTERCTGGGDGLVEEGYEVYNR